MFNISQQKHTVLSYAKDLRQAEIRVDDDFTRAQQTERRGLDLDFQILKGKGKGISEYLLFQHTVSKIVYAAYTILLLLSVCGLRCVLASNFCDLVGSSSGTILRRERDSLLL